MVKTVRETIKDIIRDHLKKKKGKVFGQCLTAVGWVGGTLPKLFEKDGMIELSMADVAGGGIVVGSALMNEKPIYVIICKTHNILTNAAGIIFTIGSLTLK